MAKNFNNLLAKMSPESRKRVESKARHIAREIRLEELRKAVDKTQSEIAEAMNVSQAAVSQLENGKRGIVLETLERYLNAIGAELIVSAKFDDEEIRLSLDDLRRTP